ncbi:hypothetical protein [Nocardia lasii]|uniref:Uncharacterized protein n=1 Tax=Nocardia lasii TaxID=1616107 RepID=A0ABW1JZ29_9NOCA
MTDEEGTISGELDVMLDDAGRGLVRYRDTDTWYTIGNLEGEPARTWECVADLVKAIKKVAGTRDAVGNAVVFEA